ncbi:MAG: DUF3105 domain-containing protein [candidate division Zixibacteria bacterium]|nr:DUF3105 domain-containing protein [Gammaproteobacteria bacterium]NIX56268.1 DUF3105 domain-containing protein [candidate division Zixibacteria bacterium]
MADSQRKRIQDRRQQEQRRQAVTFGLIGFAVLALIAILIVQAGKGNEFAIENSADTIGVGTQIPVLSADHVQDGNPVDSPSDPPTSGTHYGTPMPAGIYDTSSPEFQQPHDGYLIHSLEHGYIVFWYNCDLLDDDSCGNLLGEIEDVMDEFNGIKLIAFPRPTIEVPLVMTSWGYLQEFDTFDRDLAVEFIETNRRLAPEPGGA